MMTKALRSTGLMVGEGAKPKEQCRHQYSIDTDDDVVPLVSMRQVLDFSDLQTDNGSGSEVGIRQVAKTLIRILHPWLLPYRT